jgi:thymidylate synthase
MSLNVYDIPDGPPKVWEEVSAYDGSINSNYGWAIWSPDNYEQYERVAHELRKNPNSRRAIMIYTRPSMWQDYNKNGMSDFMCTNTVQYMIRDNKLVAYVNMRSNDVNFGYRNDRYWQKYIQECLAADLAIPDGDLIWNVGSLHLYEKDFWMIDCWEKFGQNLSKREYSNLTGVKTI